MLKIICVEISCRLEGEIPPTFASTYHGSKWFPVTRCRVKARYKHIILKNLDSQSHTHVNVCNLQYFSQYSTVSSSRMLAVRMWQAVASAHVVCLLCFSGGCVFGGGVCQKCHSSYVAAQAQRDSAQMPAVFRVGQVSAFVCVRTPSSFLHLLMCKITIPLNVKRFWMSHFPRKRLATQPEDQWHHRFNPRLVSQYTVFDNHLEAWTWH